ncbi:MAG: hypothetical protein IJU31_03750 [Synergistaceae bacterium]|nr:hypothetical protein [Synergistaceae bacterium]
MPQHLPQQKLENFSVLVAVHKEKIFAKSVAAQAKKLSPPPHEQAKISKLLPSRQSPSIDNDDEAVP